MNFLQTTLLAAGVASTLLLCICAIVACGQLHRIVEGVNQVVDLLEQRREPVRRFAADHNYDEGGFNHD